MSKPTMLNKMNMN